MSRGRPSRLITEVDLDPPVAYAPAMTRPHRSETFTSKPVHANTANLATNQKMIRSAAKCTKIEPNNPTRLLTKYINPENAPDVSTPTGPLGIPLQCARPKLTTCNAYRQGDAVESEIIRSKTSRQRISSATEFNSASTTTTTTKTVSAGRRAATTKPSSNIRTRSRARTMPPHAAPRRSSAAADKEDVPTVRCAAPPQIQWPPPTFDQEPRHS